MRNFKFIAVFGLSLAVFWLANFYAGASLSVEETEQNSKTIKFFIFQNPVVLLSGGATTTQFSVFIGEKDPIIKDAYIELRGIASSGSARNITADINQNNSFPTVRQQSFTLGDNGSGRNYFRLLYSGSATASITQYFAGIITNPGNYNFYIKTDISGMDASMLQARMVITYTFTPPSAGTSTYPAYGQIISPVFDTGAANGVGYNWIIWKGSKPFGTKVKLQLGTSDNPDPASFTFRGGNGCSDGEYYEPDNNIQQEIKCYTYHNNKKYFRYKVILCSGDCSSGGSYTPQVDDIIVNWSP